MRCARARSRSRPASGNAARDATPTRHLSGYPGQVRRRGRARFTGRVTTIPAAREVRGKGRKAATRRVSV
jgi:hypothetical protein